MFLAADLCTASLGSPLAAHVQMAGANGVGVPECIAAIRHLAPYVGYPAAAIALQQLCTDDSAAKGRSVEVQRQTLPQHVVATLNALDEDFAGFIAEQFNQRWDRDDELSARERALSCLAADVLNQTLDESFALHVDLATAAGAGRTQISAVLLLVAEYGIAKAWRAYRALGDL